MKNFTLSWLFIFGLAFLTNPSLAATQEQEPLQKSQTVSGILKDPKVGEAVFLKGQIVEDLGASIYRFKDETGEIRVKITRDVMTADPLSADSSVEIHGVIRVPNPETPQVNVGLLTVKTSYVIEVKPQPPVPPIPEVKNTSPQPVME